MAVDLKSMTPKQLEKLAGDVAKEIETRSNKMREAAMKAAEKAAKEHGFDLSELVSEPPKKRGRKKAAAKPKLPPKFRNPEDPAQTWSGRGRQPEWYKKAIAAGTPPEKLAA